MKDLPEPSAVIGVTLDPGTYDRLQELPGTASAHTLQALRQTYGEPAPLDAGVMGSRPRMPRGARRRSSVTVTLTPYWVAWLRRPGCNASATVDRALQFYLAIQ